jgi:hypothetical protein
MPLPTDGELGWGDVLNAQVAADEAAAAAVSALLSSHVANSPADPHGDRAFAQSLIQPVTSGTNTASGYVVCDGTGHIPAALMPSGGGLTNWYDVKNNTYGATGSGTVDDSTAINAALAAAVAAGGGVVWIPDGTYGIGSPLVTGSGVTILLSQGAIIQRISPVLAPGVMLQNYSASNAASEGYHAVIGGKWDAIGTTNQTSTCQIFSFVNAGAVYIQNTVLKNVANGSSAFGQFFGSSNVTIENVTCLGAAPSRTRAFNQQPVFRVEQSNSSNIPGLVAGDYITGPGSTGAMCNNINILNVDLNATTASDGSGAYTAWYAMAATTGTINSASLFHTNITVDICNATAFAGAGISANNWNNIIFTANVFNNPGPGNCFNQNWVGSAPTPLYWVVDDNEQPNSLAIQGSTTKTGSNFVAAGKIPVLNGYTYLVQGWFMYQGNNTNANVMYKVSGPGSGNISSFVQYPNNDGSAMVGGRLGYNTELDGPNYTNTSDWFIIYLNGMVTTTADGTVNLNFATSGGTLTVNAYYLSLIPVYS